MSAFAPIVLKDFADVEHTFNPRDIKNGVATYVESTGVPVADKTVSVSVNRTTTGRMKITYKAAIPIVQDVTINGVSKPTVVRTGYADISFTFDSTSSLTERRDFRRLIVTALDDSGLEDSIDLLATVY
jgi:hypothetical protein